ncbi:ABC transporter ATP-binding protein [Enterococcus xiangfangensis]|uniref:ABC transporter ATP-binding protein n=1 Tax=Enterococcus xiangfangensis TaxID=1296537 RepID=UPI0010F85109|nr:ABC transporter ATP-binding protein [Enterococcus xiangfangensis]MBM7711005.1 osmoprotectant transport system ATP-binding protein [Enterococcus xiangfangensis]
MIEFEQVEKRYGEDSIAVQPFDLTIDDNQFICVIGTSGSGKTTLLRMINRMIEPSNGSIKINGQDVTKLNEDELRRKIGYVIQNVGLFPHMTIRENIMIVPKLLKWSEEKKAGIAERLIQRVELPLDYLERKPKNLSGGQQQRIGVIRALAASQDIILMDEPFGALDPITRDALQVMIKGLQQEMRKTIVFVTHDMDEAIKLADKIIIMDHGEIMQYADVTTILEHPVNSFVEELIGKRKRNSYYNNGMTVSDLMVDRVEAISISKSITEAIRQMSEKKVDTLLVVDDQNCLKGFVDINFIEHNISKLKPTSSVFEIMETDTASVNENDRVADVIEPLINHIFKYLPVVDNEEHLVGIVTRSSLVSLVQKQLQ